MKRQTNFVRPVPESYWVVPGRFLAGEYPGSHSIESARQRMDAFLAAGFDTFIDLTRPDELFPYLPVLADQARVHGIEACYQRFPIGDLGVPTPEQMAAALDTIDEAVAQGRKVYLHCWGGIGRTGTMSPVTWYIRGWTARQPCTV